MLSDKPEFEKNNDKIYKKIRKKQLTISNINIIDEEIKFYDNF